MDFFIAVLASMALLVSGPEIVQWLVGPGTDRRRPPRSSITFATLSAIKRQRGGSVMKVKTDVVF